MTTEVVPEPNSCKAALCREFIALARNAKLPATRLSFEGYLNAYTTSTALKQCLPFFNQTCLITQLERVRTSDEKLTEIFGQQNQNEYAVFRSYYQ
jgi:branched-chain amino acid transport system substrate-binding protein